MHVYFVRHGETLLNTRRMHQSPGTPLSLKGRDDALGTAEYLRGVNPDKLLTSEYTRARETARLIGVSLGIEPEVSGYFHEIIRPSKFYGKSHFSPDTLLYMFLSLVNRNNPSWHFADGENFAELSKRAQNALTYIESLESTCNSVVIVSHTIFINLMVAYMCNNQTLTMRNLFVAYFHIETLRNGGVVHVEYTKSTDKNVCAWRRIGKN